MLASWRAGSVMAVLQFQSYPRIICLFVRYEISFYPLFISIQILVMLVVEIISEVEWAKCERSRQVANNKCLVKYAWVFFSLKIYFFAETLMCWNVCLMIVKWYDCATSIITVLQTVCTIIANTCPWHLHSQNDLNWKIAETVVIKTPFRNHWPIHFEPFCNHWPIGLQLPS